LQAELDECRSRAAVALAESEVQGRVSAGDEPDEPRDQPERPLDLSEAKAVLGTKVELDDLKLIEGIGPKIASLCHGIGIRTWLDLSTTEVSLLQMMLSDAGSRYAAHDPSTWPEQAGLLAAGRWNEFKVLTDGLSGGRATD
jgi:predicted flap endonuclease-1-like 5' DNA nuclease